MKKLLVVVDYQKDFVNGALGFAQAETLEEPIAKQVQQALADGWQVLFTFDTHDSQYLSSREGQFLPIPHCIKNTEGWNLYGSLQQYQSNPPQGVHLLEKPTFGCAALPEKVRQLFHGEPEEIALCGIVTNICVVSNAILLHSNFLSSKISVLGNLCAAPNPVDHENTLSLLKGMGYNIV